jgi:hypothetical protein
LAGALGLALDLLDEEPVGGFRKQAEIREACLGEPFADLVQALRDRGKTRASTEE